MQYQNLNLYSYNLNAISAFKFLQEYPDETWVHHLVP